MNRPGRRGQQRLDRAQMRRLEQMSRAALGLPTQARAAPSSAPSPRKRALLATRAEATHKVRRTQARVSEARSAAASDGGLPSDTLAALSMLAAQTAGLRTGLPVPVVPYRHLYRVIPDRSAADRELLALRRAGAVRQLLADTGADETFLALTSDVRAFLRQLAADAADAAGEDAALTRAAALALSDALDACTDVVAPREELMAALRESPWCGEDAAEAFAERLQRLGLLRRARGHDVLAFAFSLPGMGVFVKNVTRGRKEALAMVKRAPFGEMLVSALSKKKLRGSTLGAQWHARDLQCGEWCRVMETQSGAMLRIAE